MNCKAVYSLPVECFDYHRLWYFWMVAREWSVAKAAEKLSFA